MNGFSFLFQSVKIVFGFILALLAGGVFLAWGFFQPSHPQSAPADFVAIFGTGVVMATVIGGAVAVPAALAIVVAEIGRFSGLVFHLAVGGVIALFIWTLGGAQDASILRPGTPIALTAGFLAGFVYWGVAGRTAGCWRNTPVANSKPGRRQDLF